MVTLGIDAHKRTHTVVAVDRQGRQLARKTVGTNTKDHLGLLKWAEQFRDDEGLLWAVEDCRHLSRRLERDLLRSGQAIVRVPPKLMAHVRGSAYGKSDPIDALAVARAAQREPDLAVARLDGPDRDPRLLCDHRESLVNDRTRVICRLRWFLHELDPSWEPKARSLDRVRALERVSDHIAGFDGTVARLARELVGQAIALTVKINDLTGEIAELTSIMAPALIAVPGCGALTAAKILGETAGVDRFKSKDAYARHNGTAPMPVWSSNKARHRLSRTGNRQLNTALHRMALTHARWHTGESDDGAAQSRRRQRPRSPSSPQAPTLRRGLRSVTTRPRRQPPTPRRLTEELETVPGLGGEAAGTRSSPEAIET